MARTNRRRAAICTSFLLGAAALTGVGAAAITASPDTDGRLGPSDEPFDPVTAVLGIDSPTERAMLQEAQAQAAVALDRADRSARSMERSRTSAASDPLPTVTARDAEVVTADAAFDLAVDDLYERAAHADEAAEARKTWTRCMRSRGYRAPDREVLLATLNDPASPDGRIRRIGADLDRCDAQLQPQLNSVLRRLLPEWKSDHRREIVQYQRALGLPTS